MLSTNLKSLSEKHIAFLIILLIVVVYLHPIFLGKVDTPIDIRNINMYPWRYYAVDKKVKNVVLWEKTFTEIGTVVDKDSGFRVLKLNTPPNSSRELLIKLNLDEILLNELDDSKEVNYYLTFEFKPIYDKFLEVNFGVSFVNKITGSYYTPGVAIHPGSYYKENQPTTWYSAYFPLNNLLKTLKSIKDLGLYDIQLRIKNNNVVPATLLLQDFKIISEDFSRVQNVHNKYINDLIQWFIPAREYFSESLKKGKIPFWSNYTLTGSEFVAEPQVGFFHPLYFLTYLFFDHFTAHSILTFLCLLLCGIGAFSLVRYWKLGFAASLLTSIVYMFHPFNVTWFSFEHMLMNSAALPFLILSYEKNINNPRLLNKHLVASAFLLGLIFISGHLQIVYYTVIFFVLFAFFRFMQSIFYSESNYLKHIFSILFVCSFALMIGAIVLITFLPLFESSHRVPNSEDFIKSTSIPLEAFKGLLYPYYSGYPYESHTEINSLNSNYVNGFFRNYVYFGLLPFLFSLFSLRMNFQKRLTIFFLLTIVFSLLMCTGSPLFFRIKDYVPGFSHLQHYRFLEVYSFCVPFLSGIGFQILINHISFLKRRIVNIFVSVVLVIIVVDLMYYSSYFITWSNKASYKPLYKGGALEFLVKRQKELKEPFRILPFSVDKIELTKLKVNAAQPNTLQPYKLEEVSGCSSLISKDLYYLFVYIQTLDPTKLYPKEIINLFLNTNIPYPIYNFKSKILDLLNVKYFLVPKILTLDSKTTKKIFSNDCTIYENTDYLPRAFVVPNYEVIHAPRTIAAELESAWFNPYKQVILMSLPEYRSRINKINNQALDLKYNIEFIKYESDNITLKVNINRPGFLVLGNNLNNNWRVKVNNTKGKHFQANLVQRAVYLPSAGEYVVEFYYFPLLFLIGLSITSFAVIILLTLFIFLTYKEKAELKKEKAMVYRELERIEINV